MVVKAKSERKEKESLNIRFGRIVESVSSWGGEGEQLMVPRVSEKRKRNEVMGGLERTIVSNQYGYGVSTFQAQSRQTQNVRDVPVSPSEDWTLSEGDWVRAPCMCICILLQVVRRPCCS